MKDMSSSFGDLFKTKGWGPPWLAGLPAKWDILPAGPKDPTVYAKALCIKYHLMGTSWAPAGTDAGEALWDMVRGWASTSPACSGAIAAGPLLAAPRRRLEAPFEIESNWATA